MRKLVLTCILLVSCIAHAQEEIVQEPLDILFQVYVNSEDTMLVDMDEENPNINSWGDREVLLKICADGDIYWRGRLVTTDKELTDALRSVIIEYRCPECKRRLNERHIPDTKNP